MKCCLKYTIVNDILNLCDTLHLMANAPHCLLAFALLAQLAVGKHQISEQISGV